MKKIIFVFLSFSFFTVLSAENVSACTCSLPRKAETLNKVVKQAYQNASAMFVGKVIEVNQKLNVFFVEVIFRVEQKWRSEIGETITITTGKGGGDCGYQFMPGEKYLVYASGENKLLQTNICTKTALAENNKDIAVLDKIVSKKAKSSPK